MSEDSSHVWGITGAWGGGVDVRARGRPWTQQQCSREEPARSGCVARKVSGAVSL